MDPPEKLTPIPLNENKISKYKISASYVRQKLDYYTQDQKVRIELIAKEERLIHAIMRLYKIKTEGSNQKPDVITTGIKNIVTIRITLKELLHYIYFGKKVSGSNIKDLKETLGNLTEKEFRISGEMKPLIKIQSISDKKNAKSTITYEVVLNPILTDKIEEKYVLFPECIDERTLIASKRLTDSIITLRDWCCSHISVKHYRVSMKEENLIRLLRLEKYLSGRNKKKAIDRISNAIEVCKELELISKCEVRINKYGEKIYNFNLLKLRC